VTVTLRLARAAAAALAPGRRVTWYSWHIQLCQPECYRDGLTNVTVTVAVLRQYFTVTRTLRLTGPGLGASGGSRTVTSLPVGH
jgi:hypothetical protein